MIYCLGTQLPVKLAKGRLARLRTPSGTVPDVRFLSRYFLRDGEQLLHGVELAAQCLDVTPEDLAAAVARDAEWNFYTVDTIDEMLRQVSGADETMLNALRSGFARMMAFDALVGANDRHPQNWGLIQRALDRRQPLRFAPLFDTARGLFWNNADDKLAANDRRTHREQFIRQYAEKSRPLIGTNAKARPNHFEVIEYMMSVDHGRRYGRDLRAVIRAFHPQHARKLLHERFQRVVSRLRLEFVFDLLCHRHETLSLIVST
jgi:hypothetical protein